MLAANPWPTIRDPMPCANALGNYGISYSTSAGSGTFCVYKKKILIQASLLCVEGTCRPIHNLGSVSQWMIWELDFTKG